MTPRHSLIGKITEFKVLGTLWRRVALFGPLLAVLVALSFFPERFRAASTLTPSDPSTLGLSGALGQLGALNSVFGKQTDVEIALRVGSSFYTRETVIKELDLKNRLRDEDIIDLHRWLEREVTVRSLRGGIIIIEMENRDAKLARDIVSSFAMATRERLAEINRRQTAYKREVLEDLVADASERLDRAQSAYNGFRLRHGYASPGVAVEVINQRVPGLQEGVRAKDVEISAARRLYTDDNIIVIQLQAERDALMKELQEALAKNPRAGSGTVSEAVGVSTELFKLERELNTAKGLYDSYTRYLEGTAVEDITSTANIRILEEPYVDTERQIWLPAAASGLAIFLLWLAVEFYRLRPPVGAQVPNSRRATVEP